MINRKSTNSISTLLSSFLILILVVGVVGFLFIFTNNFSTDVKTFYIKQENDLIISDRENYEITVGKEYKFEITTILGDTENFEISVVPNTNVNESLFEFIVNGAYHQFAYENDITKGFDMKAYENYFTFSANKDLGEILQMNYPNKTISKCPTAFNTNIPYFRLVVKNIDTQETININFSIFDKTNDNDNNSNDNNNSDIVNPFGDYSIELIFNDVNNVGLYVAYYDNLGNQSAPVTSYTLNKDNTSVYIVCWCDDFFYVINANTNSLLINIEEPAGLIDYIFCLKDGVVLSQNEKVYIDFYAEK